MDRVQKAKELFLSGFNCAQSIFIAFGDIFGMQDDNARRLAGGLGAGIGRMRGTCGVVTSGSLILSLVYGATEGEDQLSKAKVYEKVREYCTELSKREETLVCRELLGIDKAEESCMPEKRTAEYYAKRPCLRLVEESAEILCRMLEDAGISLISEGEIM